jgi:nitrile hydratase beta subunit
MEGIHDLGGMQGFGRVEPEPDEPPFHEPWEGRVHGAMLSLGMAGALPPGFRFAIERMDPVHYLTSSYYEHWLACIETLLTEAGTLSPDEIEAKEGELAGGAVVPRREDAELTDRVRMILRPFPIVDGAEPNPLFSVGDRVRVRRFAPVGHTRCPRYVRGVVGVVERFTGTHTLHDALVMKGEHRLEPVYAVAFRAADLWDVESDHAVIVELWESYLEEDAVG